MRAQPLKGQRILITGGAGLIGSHIADQLVETGAAEIIVFDNFTRGRMENLKGAARSGLLRVVEGDLRDLPLLRSVMDGVDVVFHQAAIRITQCAEQPRVAMEVLANGTFNVLEAAVEAGVKKIVAASSASVYGLAGHFPTTEDHHAYNNRTIYGAAKSFNESLLRSFHEMYRLEYVALRYFNVYGPRMDIQGVYTEVLIRWMERIARQEPPVIFGDGSQTMDFVWVEDIARANLLAASSDVSDDVFNVASGRETSLRELAEALMDAMGCRLPIEYRPERKVNPVARRLADTSRAQLRLGFESSVGIEEGLEKLVKWWRQEQTR